jgi:hypothetical protein
MIMARSLSSTNIVATIQFPQCPVAYHLRDSTVWLAAIRFSDSQAKTDEPRDLRAHLHREVTKLTAKLASVSPPCATTGTYANVVCALSDHRGTVDPTFGFRLVREADTAREG